MNFQSFKEHPHWDKATEFALQAADEDILTLVHYLFPASYPPTNVWLTNDEAILLMELPGWNGNSITVSASDSRVTVYGEKRNEENFSDAQCLISERFQGAFSRTFELNYSVNPEEIYTNYINGILEIHFKRI